MCRLFSHVVCSLALAVFLYSNDAVRAQTGSRDSLPKLLKPIQIDMNDAGLAANIEGEIDVLVSIRKDGTVSKAEHFSGPMIRCGVEADKLISRIWKLLKPNVLVAQFSPAIKNGKAVESHGHITLIVGKKYATAVRLEEATSKIRSGEFSDSLVRDPNLSKRVLKKVPPNFPANLTSLSIGHDELSSSVIIDESGLVTFVGPLEGLTEFQEEARKALCLWRFSPMIVEGRTVRTIGTVDLYFTRP